jgi:hypothetical protein
MTLYLDGVAPVVLNKYYTNWVRRASLLTYNLKACRVKRVQAPYHITTHTHSLTHSLTHSHTHTLTHSHTHPLTHSHTLTRSHTHSHTPPQVPTISYHIQFWGRPSALSCERGGWVRAVFKTGLCVNGFLITDGEIWDGVEDR